MTKIMFEMTEIMPDLPVVSRGPALPNMISSLLAD